MARVSVKAMRDNLRDLIERAGEGEEIVVTRRGQEVARLVPPESHDQRLPDLSEFRASISLSGEPASETIEQLRREARY